MRALTPLDILGLGQSGSGTASGDTVPRRSNESNPDTLAREQCLVLVVDDDYSLRSVIAEFLEDEGFRVQGASNGLEALACINMCRPTVVVLDMYLPVMDGWSFADELRAKGIELPIIVMSAAANARQMAREIGAPAYVSKPVSFFSLLKRIDDLCAY